MTALDAVLVGATLFALMLAGLGAYAHRSRSSSPYWYWGWAVLLLAGVGSEASKAYADVAFVAPLLSPVFSALLLAGALSYAGRSVPPPLIVAGLAMGVLRAVSEALGQTQVSGALSLVFEPTAAAWAAWLVHGTARHREGSWAERLMPLSLAAITLAEFFGAMRALGGFERLIVWPLWVGASAPLLGLQSITTMGRARRAEERSEVDQRARDQATERFAFLTSRMREVITELGPDGRVVWVSENAAEELGIDPSKLLGKLPAELMGDHRIQPVDEPATSPEGSGEPGVRSSVYSFRDGYGRDRWFDVRVAEGENRLLSIARDVTDRVRAEEEIRASEARMRKFSLLGSDYCYVATGSDDGNVENWLMGSLEEISGYTHEELQQLGFTSFIHPDDIEESRSRVLGLLENGGESSHEFRLIARSGEIRWIAERLLVERQGRRFRVYGAARDVTDQRRLEQALARSQKLESLGLLAGGVAHDFNNLLMVIMGNAEIATESLDEGRDAREDLDGIIEAAQQARSLTQQLLAYAGRGAVEQAPVDITERVRSVSELLTSAGSTGVDLQLDLEESLPTVLADPGELQQLVMNLVLNAIEACDGEGRVLVATREAHARDLDAAHWNVGGVVDGREYVVLEVVDSGGGMSSKTQDRVFDPFFTTKATGRGLGLAAVSGSVRSLGGALRLSSTRWKGTTFTVVLPASDRSADSSEGEVAAPAVGGRILVIDDDDRVLAVATRMLETRGFEVESATDGQTGIEAYRAKPFDVVVVDAVMPGLSGAEFFDALREEYPDAVVLMASGFDEERAVGDLLGRGLAGFIGKPFLAQELVERIRGLIG